METFRYSPLSKPTEIRLLKIIRLDPLQCEISHHDLGAYEYVPRYTALSYCWGNANDRCEISCNEKRLSITRTLLVALKMTHDYNPNQYIWADQVCIDQVNITEKPQQIKIMTALYQNAWTVIAWLGPEDLHTKPALEHLYKIVYAFVEDEEQKGKEKRREEEEEGEDDASVQTKSHQDLSKALFDSYEDDVDSWLAFSNFFDRPWFERIWVVQEMLPIQEDEMTRQIEAYLVCGSHIVQWNAVIAAAQWIERALELRRGPPTDPDRRVDGIYHVNNLRVRPLSRMATVTSSEGITNRFVGRYTFEFFRLLQHSRNRAATDQRDKVYGLIGLSDFTDDRKDDDEQNKLHMFVVTPRISIDYSLSVLEVYRNVARGLIEFNSEYSQRMRCEDPCEEGAPGALDFLIEARPYSSDPDWPSWIPDWRSPYNSDVGRPFLDRGYSSGNIYARLYHHPDPNCLKVGGVILGQTTWVHDKRHCPEVLFVDDPRRVSDIVISHIGPEYTHGNAKGQDTATAFYNMLTFHTLPYLFKKLEISHEIYREKRLLYRIFDIARDPSITQDKIIWPLLDLIRDEAGVDISTYEKIDTAAKVFVNHLVELGQYMTDNLCERRFFVTDQGYLGMGDHHMQEGDVIAILFGMRKACILRPFTMKNGVRAYQYIGYAWAEGAMDGEAVAGLPKDERGVPFGEEILLR